MRSSQRAGEFRLDAGARATTQSSPTAGLRHAGTCLKPPRAQARTPCRRREGARFISALMRAAAATRCTAYCSSALRRRIAQAPRRSAAAPRTLASRWPRRAFPASATRAMHSIQGMPLSAAIATVRASRCARAALISSAPSQARGSDRGAVPAAQRGAIRLQCLEPVRPRRAARRRARPQRLSRSARRVVVHALRGRRRRLSRALRPALSHDPTRSCGALASPIVTGRGDANSLIRAVSSSSIAPAEEMSPRSSAAVDLRERQRSLELGAGRRHASRAAARSIHESRSTAPAGRAAAAPGSASRGRRPASRPAARRSAAARRAPIR